MYRHFFALLVLILPLLTKGYGQAISEKIEDSLYRSIITAKHDTDKISRLLTFAEYLLYESGGSKRRLDSAGQFILQAEQISKHLNSVDYKRRVLLYRAKYNFKTGAFNKGKSELMQIIDYYHRNGDIYHEAVTWNELGNIIYYDDLDHASVRLNSYRHAWNLFKKGKYQLESIAAYKNMADVHFNQGKLDLAERELLTVLAQYRLLHYGKIHYTYDLLATVYNAKNDQKKELYYRLLMLQTMGTFGPPQERVSLIMRVIRLYRNLGRFDKCIDLANQAVNLYRNMSHDDLYYAAICAGANAYISMKKYSQALVMLTKIRLEKGKTPFATQYINMVLGNYYDQLNQYSKAEYFYLKAFNYFKQTTDRGHVKQYCQNIGVALANIKIRQRDFRQARQYVDFLLARIPVKDQLFNSKLEHAQFKLDSAAGNFKLAIKHFEKYKTIEDSLYNITKSRQIAELDIQYETRQKEQSIKVLHSDAASKNAMLDKVNLQRNIILAVMVLSCILTVMAYRFYLYKQQSNKSILKSNKLIKSKNKQLEYLVEEKEWLLKEVQHRVKNNLHTIICLLESQAAYLENDALKAIEKSQNRIYTISLIHQKLYQSEEIHVIDMASYIPELVQYLKDSFQIASDKIYFRMDINPISLDPSIAVPVALIINEALTNSIKYAFPGNLHGEISISFLQQHDRSIKLELADNGVGLDENFENFDPDSLGIQLIKGLSKEIQGHLSINSKGGFSITVVFEKHDTYGQQQES